MSKYKKRIMVITALCLAAALAVGGYLWSQSKAKDKLSLIYIPKTEDGTNDFWTSLISGTRMAAKEYNVDLKILAPNKEQDVERQTELLEQAIEEKPDAILFTPSSYSVFNDLLEQAKKQKIPVVYIDSYAEADTQALTVATDNLEAGRKLGKFAKGIVEEGDQVAIVGHVKDASTAIEREQGFREGMGELEENIVDVVFCDSLFDKAYELTMDLMEKYPNLRMIAGLNEYSSVGAARAVKAAGAEGRIKVVGIDSSLEAVEMMEQGVFQGFVVQKPFKMGYVGVRETVRMLKGEKTKRNINSGSELVTPDNIYTSEIEKLVFPFNIGKQKSD